MPNPFLEHVNVTVSDTRKTANMLCDLFDWKIRWEGEAIHGGHTIHVGNESSYIAVYSGIKPTTAGEVTYDMIGGLNHIAVVVTDLKETENRVREAGFTPHSHADYEPGERFYFRDGDEIEFEIVSYA